MVFTIYSAFPPEDQGFLNCTGLRVKEEESERLILSGVNVRRKKELN